MECLPLFVVGFSSWRIVDDDDDQTIFVVMVCTSCKKQEFHLGKMVAAARSCMCFHFDDERRWNGIKARGGLRQLFRR